MNVYVITFFLLITKDCLQTTEAGLLPSLNIPTLEELKEKWAQTFANRPKLTFMSTTEYPPPEPVLPLMPPTIELPSTTPVSIIKSQADSYVDSTMTSQNKFNHFQSLPSIKTRTFESRARPDEIYSNIAVNANSDSSFDYDDFKTVATWLSEVPRGHRLRHIGRNVIRRAMHSFINNDKHTLEGISPRLDIAHHVINTMGRMLLPHPDRLQLTNTIPSLIPEYVFQRKLRKKMALEKYMKDKNDLDNDLDDMDLVDDLAVGKGII